MPGSEVAAIGQQRPPAGTKSWRKRLLILGVLAVAGLFALFLLSRAGSFLIINAPQRSDVIVVLDGEWPQAVKLQKEGYAPRSLLDANTNYRLWGKSEAEMAAEFLERSKPPGMEICLVASGSTFNEAAEVQRCLQPLQPQSVLLVASDFDTRRTLSIFRTRLPQYRWSIAASSAPYHDADQYWKHRAWAKTVLNGWEQYLWWKLADQWRSDVVLH